MIDFSSREVKTVVKFTEQGQEAWFEIRYLSQRQMDTFLKKGTDLDVFKWIVLDWGDDFKSPKGKDWPCTEKNKEEFYNEIPDLTAKLIAKSWDKWSFATDTTEVISHLGKSRSTKEIGDKRKQPHTTQTVVSA